MFYKIHYSFISKLPTRENSVSLPVVSSGVATLKSSEELSYNTLQLFLHLHCRNIFAVSCSEIIQLERKGRCSCSVHLLTNRESLDLNSQGDIFLGSICQEEEIGSQPGPSLHLHLGLVSSVESRHIEWRYYLFSKQPTSENSDSLPAVSLGVATLNSSEELSKITIITITFTSEIFSLV